MERRGIFSEHDVVAFSGAAKLTTRQAVEALSAVVGVRFVQPVFRAPRDTFDILPLNRIVVAFKPTATARDIATVVTTYALELEAAPRPDSGRFDYWYRYPQRSTKLPLEIASSMSQEPAVAWVNPDWVSMASRKFQSPNDPYYSLQYYLRNTGQPYNGIAVDVRAEAAWLVNRGGGLPSAGGMLVAVLDDGVLASHPDFGGRVVYGYDAFGNNSFGCTDCAQNPLFNDTHGTNVAGVIGASRDNAIGISGLAPDATIFPIRIFRHDTVAASSLVTMAIDYAWSVAHAQILNNSWGKILGPFSAADPAINAAITRAATQGRGNLGAITVIAAGNCGSRAQNDICAVGWPAQQPDVISASAISRTGEISDYATRGPRIDVVAPSSMYVPIFALQCPYPTDLVSVANPARSCLSDPLISDAFYTSQFGGTSAAAPQVAAAAAMLLTDNPNLTFTQVRDRIRERAIAWGAAQDFGSGKLDAFRVLRNDLTAYIPGRSFVPVGDNTFRVSASGAVGPYSYHWYVSYGQGSTSYFDTGITETSFTQNFVPGDVINFQVVVTDPSGSVTATKTAFAQ